MAIAESLAITSWGNHSDAILAGPRARLLEIVRAAGKLPDVLGQNGQIRRDRLFFCHARAKDPHDRRYDERFLERLRTFITPKAKRYGAQVFYDAQTISDGSEWNAEICAALLSTRCAVFLVTPEFLTSEYVNDVELPYLTSESRVRELKIFPVLSRECCWTDVPLLAELQFAHDIRTPLKSFTPSRRDRELKAICDKVGHALANAAE